MPGTLVGSPKLRLLTRAGCFQRLYNTCNVTFPLRSVVNDIKPHLLLLSPLLLSRPSVPSNRPPGLSARLHQKPQVDFVATHVPSRAGLSSTHSGLLWLYECYMQVRLRCRMYP